jgi:hypothetical protein
MLCHSAAQTFRANLLARVCPFVVAFLLSSASPRLAHISFARADTAAPHPRRKIPTQDTTTYFTCIYIVYNSTLIRKDPLLTRGVKRLDASH